jgi:hypothetical protein
MLLLSHEEEEEKEEEIDWQECTKRLSISRCYKVSAMRRRCAVQERWGLARVHKETQYQPLLQSERNAPPLRGTRTLGGWVEAGQDLEFAGCWGDFFYFFFPCSFFCVCELVCVCDWMFCLFV